MQSYFEIKVFIIVTTVIVFTLAVLTISLLFVYRKKQYDNSRRIDTIKSEYEKALLNTQIEVQEQTFQYMSSEIHDNINLSLTLAKLNLNTLDWTNPCEMQRAIKSSINTLSIAIVDLSNLSKSTSTDTIRNLGLLNSIQLEIERIQLTNKFEIKLTTLGDPFYLDCEKELIIFRIIQEAFNNAIKHSHAKNVFLNLIFESDSLIIIFEDDGIGFKPVPVNSNKTTTAAGLQNMRTRTKLIGGQFAIDSIIGRGTKITFKLPNNG